MRKRLKKNLSIGLITTFLVVVLIVSALQLTGFIHILAVSDYNTGISPDQINYCNTQRFWQDCWNGQAVPGTGYPNQEMMPDVKYITSFSGATGDDALSERISIVGNLYEDDWVEVSHPNRGYYSVYIRTDPQDPNWQQIVGWTWSDPQKVIVTGGTGWRTCNYNPLGGAAQEIWISPIEIRLKGSIVGAIKVEATYEFSGLISTWQKTMSIDYAYLASGNGKINVEGYTQQDVPMFEIGDTVPIYVEADYSGATASDTGRWQLWAFPLRGGSGRLLNEWNYDYFRETYQWTLPSDAWVRGATTSKWRLELRNTLFSTDAVMINTIDVKANAPPTPTISTSPDVPQVGQAITVTMSANTNANTNERILKFIVRGVYLDNNFQFVLKDVTPTPGTADPYTATTTITPPRAGRFRLQVWAHDVAGRESEVPAEKTIEMHEGNYRLTVTVYDQYNSFVITGATVARTGGESKTTDSLGRCWFDLNQGSYEFQIQKQGYRAVTQSWTIASDKDVSVYLTRTTNTWDLDVTVKDSNGSTVWGATVKVGGTEKLTDQTGIANFRDLAEGDYIVTAEKGTKSGEQDVTLDRSKSISITIKEGGGGDGELDSMTLLLYAAAAIGVLVAIVAAYYYMKRKRQAGR
ncbi:MAG: carboxypeptidase regulatory-like domain-containing protein [Thermoplasmata archaeon]|nr:carboxypeptidase regulatory-like domain-containing protein [Thermoplasmata archaeon]MBE3142173.1 carboxypeptidase regulatory-like domain-containing protein [Thermoplasmata archaeon]